LAPLLAVRRRACSGPASWRLLLRAVGVLRHGVAGLLQLLDARANGGGVVGFELFLETVDGLADRRLVGVGEFGLVLLEELLHLLDALVGFVAGVHQLAFLLVVGGM